MKKAIVAAVLFVAVALLVWLAASPQPRDISVLVIVTDRVSGQEIPGRVWFVTEPEAPTTARTPSPSRWEINVRTRGPLRIEVTADGYVTQAHCLSESQTFTVQLDRVGPAPQLNHG